MSEEEIKRLFNEAGYAARLARRELRAVVIKDAHPSRTKAREPYCTRSQLVQYIRNDGRAVVLVHRYLRTDGTIGASGSPDPKRLYVADAIISVGLPEDVG